MGQFVATRATTRHAVAERLQALRAERKESIFRFLSILQEAEGVAEQWRTDGERDRSVALAVTHRLWLAQKELEVVCSEQLRDPAFAFTRAVRDAIWRMRPKSRRTSGGG